MRELLELVGLADAGKRYPHQLSGGMQQRVALARALAIEPSVLLLDEPLSALDAKVRVQLREEIRRIQLELGITTIYVTHDQEEALSISDRVAVMYGGKIEQVGAPAEMYGNPATPFVAEFIGTMNRLVATVGEDGDDRLRRAPAPRRRGAGACRAASACSASSAPRRSTIVADERRHARERPRRRGDLAHLPRLDDARAGRSTRPGSGRSRPTSRPRRPRRSRSARGSSRLPARQARACSAWPTSQRCPCQIRKVCEDPGDAELLQLEHARRLVDRVDERVRSPSRVRLGEARAA